MNKTFESLKLAYSNVFLSIILKTLPNFQKKINLVQVHREVKKLKLNPHVHKVFFFFFFFLNCSKSFFFKAYDLFRDNFFYFL